MTKVNVRKSSAWVLKGDSHTSGGGPGPGPGPGGTCQFGVDISMNTSSDVDLRHVYLDHRTTYGGSLNGHIKFFDGGAGVNVPMTSMNTTLSGFSDEGSAVICFKSFNLTNFNTAMNSASAAFPLYMVYYQEPEDDGKKGVSAATPSVYCSIYSQMNAARQAHPKGAFVYLVKDLMRYQETVAVQTGFDITAYHGGQTFVDYIGADCYSNDWDVTMRTAVQMFGWLKTFADAHTMKWCVPEMGLAISKAGDTETARATRLQTYIDYLKTNGCAWVNYWCDGNTGNGDWRLEGHPGLATWTTAMRG